MSIPEIWDKVIDSASFHALFYSESGCVVLKGAYTPEIMERYNAWCIRHLDSIKTNARHPKQWSKRLINDVMERMADDDPCLLAALVDNPRLTSAVDALLGFARFGAVTTHWSEPGGDRQQTHVDYPCHVKSGPFWENDPAKLQRMFTVPQLEHSLAHYSVQALIAADAMGEYNGSTEVIPGRTSRLESTPTCWSTPRTTNRDSSTPSSTRATFCCLAGGWCTGAARTFPTRGATA